MATVVWANAMTPSPQAEPWARKLYNCLPCSLEIVLSNAGGSTRRWETDAPSESWGFTAGRQPSQCMISHSHFGGSGTAERYSDSTEGQMVRSRASQEPGAPHPARTGAPLKETVDSSPVTVGNHSACLWLTPRTLEKRAKGWRSFIHCAN